MAPGKTGHALITGAARRIGRAIAIVLAEGGWTVGIHCRHSIDDAKDLQTRIEGDGGTAYVVRADLTDDLQCKNVLAQASEQAGPVDCLVNNASVFERDTIETVTRKSWTLHMETNLWAPLLLSRQMAASLPAGGSGNIINIVDQRAVNISPDFVSYTLSKAGLWALTRSLALTLAPRIRVNAIGPGPTLPSPRQTGEQFRQQSDHMPLGSGATPEEIAAGVSYILESRSMTGQMITLDGGQHLGWDFPGAERLRE